ncbi:LPS-assembly protein LptD [Leptospira sp. GIMC2001]|uniref:LPS-assembly protein LptD n=1 Tax=Leptospira sp. GIMC2001 TaxID=1513297 RepID=UPI00234A0A97|nr:LPS-assembly protein LptD [Leptospira sp. GIMC2001]WCL48006.1 LPS-assembly protein LptD [Leptospira sp. GIMC2001]
MQLKSLFIILFIIPSLLYSQTSGGFDFPFSFGNEEEKNPLEEKRKVTASGLKSKLAENSVDSLSEREVDSFLSDLGSSTKGSIYSKRQRLKSILSLDKPIEPFSLGNLPKAPKSPDRLQIESAAEGEMLSVDQTKSGVMVLRGQVRIKIGAGTLSAETVSIDSERQEVYAEGGIEYNDGPVRVRGEKFIYDFKLAKGVIYDTKASVYPIYFIGEKMKKLDEKRYILEMGYFTACNAELPHYSFKAEKIIIHEDKTVVAYSMFYQVGGTSLFWIPMGYNSSSGNGWMTQIGKNNTQGWFFQSAYQWSDAYPDSAVLPHGYKFRFDYYEKTGQATHIEMWKVTPWLNYNIDLGYANHRKYEITPAYEDRFRNGGIGNVAITNQVDRGERYPDLGLGIRDVGVKYEPWWKANINLNAKQNDTLKDGTRNIQLRYENQNQLSFDYEYGNRYQPSNSIQSLYTQRDQRFGLIRNILNWNFDYTETRGDLAVSIGASRTLIYQIQAQGFYPLADSAPVIRIANSSQIGKTPYFESPIYWNINFQNSSMRFYNPPVQKQLPFPSPITGSSVDPFGKYQEFVLRTQTLTLGETGFTTSMPLNEYISYTPSIYGGARSHSVDFPGSGQAINSPENPSNLAQREILAQDTYQYFRHNHELRMGVPALFLTTNYRKIDLEKPQQTNPVFGKSRLNEVEVALESYALDDWEVSVRSIRDFRKYSNDYDPAPTNSERWYFTIFRISGYVDFLDGFNTKRPTLLERQRSFYSGVFINNDFVYHSPLNRPLSNNLTLSYKMGGFSIPFIKNFRSFEAGGTWYHVYGKNFLDNYRFFMKTDLKVTRTIAIDFELDSRVTEPWRLTGLNAVDYYNYNTTPEIYGYQTGTNYERTNLGRDIAQGTGAAGSNQRQKTIFNINRFMTTFKMNLHNWEFRIGYSMNLRAFPGGFAGDSQLTFYDQSVFFSAGISSFSFGQAEGTEATRARVYRFRKQPLDVVEKLQSGDLR